MRHESSGTTRTGFTLLELLVVIGIIAVLVGMLLSVLIKAREQARRAKCAANLRGIGQGLTVYVTDYKHYPGHKTSRTGAVDSVAVWPTRLRRLVGGNSDLFYCPSQNLRCQWKDENASPTGYRADARHVLYGYRLDEPLLDPVRTFFSYGYNSVGTDRTRDEFGRERGLGLGDNVGVRGVPREGINRELPATRVKKPSEMIALADTIADGWNDFMILPTLATGGINPDNNPGPLYNAPARVHSGGANVLFCDGHVEWHLQSDLIAIDGPPSLAKIRMRRLWNNDHRVTDYDP